MTERQPFRIPTIGVSVDSAGCDVDDLVFCAAVQVRAGADEAWAALVERAVASGWVGVECLAGVDGRVADVTRDNVAVFGQAVADTVAAVRAWDRQTESRRTFPLIECEFRAGGSRFQDLLADGSPRFEILDVAFLFKQGDLTEPVRDPALAAALGVELGERASLTAVREVVQGTH
nr:hypothetical protein [Propionicimonas sp.]